MNVDEDKYVSFVDKSGAMRSDLKLPEDNDDDNDGIPDHKDNDDDGDGIPDAE